MKYQFEHDKIKTCGECPIKTMEEYDYEEFRLICGKTGEEISAIDKPNWCPLVEVQDD